MTIEDNPTGAPFAATVLSQAPSPLSASLRRIPPSLAARFKDIQLAGEGAMGTVYRAVDPQLGRAVAVKLLKGDAASLGRRFVAEARAQARIQHEHVCRVYEAGQADGEPYIVMQFIDGEPLSRLRGRLTLEQQVKLLLEVSEAVHEAHRLGMIHRDLKPGNILVEHREDGTWKPYVVDFGLARQVEDDHGQTQTGDIIGTPAYMSPEQAIGDVRQMDRRSDVYSLGATMYDVLTGRPPFVTEQSWKLLLMVVTEDAPPLRKLLPGVPRDIETIVMKCLEREPARRYDSAKALAEELRCVLDGEPIQAKQASWAYVLRKKAHKNKLLTALLGALVLGALGLVGVWTAAQRHAAEQAQLARELGEHLKEMELFLRSAYGLPLHDVERERNVVRARLGEIEQRMGAVGRAGVGPGHYALGLGQLALGEPEQARRHLEQALAAGYSSAELEYALGRALGELLRRALEDTRRITNDEERKKKLAQLDREIREPALVHLRAAVGARIEVPEYVEGLIALYAGRNEEAIAKAKVAFDKAPWMYEPKKLEGDALYAEGSKYRHDAAFDYEKMKGYFDRAAAAYRAAAEIGSSDPDVHRAECELWEKMGWAAAAQGLPPGPSFDAAREACDRAVRSSSRDGRAVVQRALVLLARVHILTGNSSEVSEDMIPVVDEAINAAEDGVRARPRDAMAHYAAALGNLLRTRLMYEFGRDASMQPAITGYQTVLSLEPDFTWAVNELGDAYFEEAQKALSDGREAAPLLESAIQQYERAMARDSQFLLPVGGRLEALTLRIESELARGHDAQAALEALSNAVSLFERTTSSPRGVAFWKARTQRLRALRAFALGGDPRPSVEATVEVIRAAAGESPKDTWLLKELAMCHLLEAEYARREGLDPAPALEKARAAARTAGELSAPPSQSLLQLLADIELAAIRAAARREALREERFTVAFGYLRPMLSHPGRKPVIHQLAAELHAERAAWRARRGLSPEEDIREGLTLVDEALSKNPHNPRALLAKGYLHLQRARTARPPQARTGEEQVAREAFAAALRENPVLARDIVSQSPIPSDFKEKQKGN
ncbi:serine/threonine-protein kinase [Vitiosangium sp. GDMCC 1.1324]|uniref:serine/threonine-protein kinase n=1 Tax=Vitiosangium sp. (strain GDMCC 1.1324) TaxID=2138576 RepID=UPI000D33DA5E|nr:serine/threonine-protein kinase [Vitiosangium sp. GDMCC 1.1324]PTL79566.1 serine/threonine protein kinase [Vitiosangium sp. GDMCC 1.1324]